MKISGEGPHWMRVDFGDGYDFEYVFSNREDYVAACKLLERTTWEVEGGPTVYAKPEDIAQLIRDLWESCDDATA